jgi:hypothetical protein
VSEGEDQNEGKQGEAGGGPHTLEKAEGEEYIEAAGEGAGATGEPEEEEGTRIFFLP